MSNKQVTVNIMPYCLLMSIAMAVLKFAGAIAWSWWIVTAPLWIPYAIAGAIVIIALVFGVIALLLAGAIAIFQSNPKIKI